MLESWTWKVNEVMNGDILIENNGSRAVGKTEHWCGWMQSAVDAREKRLPWLYDLPHVAYLGIAKNSVWIYAASCLCVTTTRRVADCNYGCADLKRHGRSWDVSCPRVYSTGSGVGYWMYNLKSLRKPRCAEAITASITIRNTLRCICRKSVTPSW